VVKYERPTEKEVLHLDDRLRHVAEQFDDAAERYLNWVPSPQFQQTMQRTVLASITKCTRAVLEVGCGHGTWLRFILETVPNSDSFDLHGIDVSTKRIKTARDQLKRFKNVQVFAQDFKEFAPRITYDLIFFAEVLQFVPYAEYSSILGKCYSMLSREGTLAIVDKERLSKHAIVIRLNSWRGRNAPEFRYVHYPSFRVVKRLAKKTGFVVTDFVKVKEFRGLRLCKE
jgi:cyclopropane fatty-acyl-phospholipid synthase-like methyltransferase